MPVRSLTAGQAIGAVRRQAVVWIGGSGSVEELSACLQRVAAHTPAEVAIVVSDWAPDAGPLGVDREITHIRDGDVAGAAHPADVVLLDRRCTIGAGWLEGLRDAAYCDSIVASAVPLATTDLGLEDRLDPDRFERDAEQVRLRSLRLRPRVYDVGPGCAYVRRTALELAGPLDAGFWSRCVRAGLCHIVADDVLVAGAAGALAGAAESEPAARSIAAARRSGRRLRLLIDARIPGKQATGTHLQVRELASALARSERVSLGVVVGSEAREAVRWPEGVELIDESDALSRPGDVVHRPLQVFSDWEQRTLVGMADRIVLTHLDLIGYRNPAYFEFRDAWQAFRARTRTALATSDHVVFMSGHALADALSEDLVEVDRASVVPLGVDHAEECEPRRPEALTGVGEFILCLGSDYRHKNRVFALRILACLRRDHGWPGHLVLAGPRMPFGSSSAEEAATLAEAPGLAEHTIDLGAVGDAEKEWLLRNAALVLYPTLYEGFGLVPFEAAGRGTPCMWAPIASLSGLLGEEDAPIVPWDPARSAERAVTLLRERDKADANIARIRAAGARLTWDAAAARLLEVYELTCRRPPAPAAAMARRRPELSVSEDALRLVGPSGVLGRDLERPLLALATHRVLGGPILGGIRAGYRFSHAARRLARRSRDARP